jgi:hypothetical protein
MEIAAMDKRRKVVLPVSERPFFVYFLRDPRDMKARYVGISSEPAKRFNNHLHFGYRVPNTDWINELRAEGLLPIQHVVIGPVTKRQAERVEARLMRLFSVKHPGQLLQKVFKAKSEAILRRFGCYDIDERTPFARTNTALGLIAQ